MSSISKKDPATPPLDDEEDAAVSVPDTGDAGEGGKLKMIVQLVKKCFGVKDIATMCVFKAFVDTYRRLIPA